MKHTGYGNAAGLLAARGLLGGKNDRKSMEYSSDDDDSDTEEYSAVVNMVDPITGTLWFVNGNMSVKHSKCSHFTCSKVLPNFPKYVLM